MINFNSKNEGVWFYFDEDNQDLGGVCLRMPTADEYDSIRSLTVKPGKPDYYRGQRYETEKTNEKLSQKLSIRKLIVDWKGVGLDGNIMECNDDNKEKMMNLPNPDFRLFIGECSEKLVDGNKTIEEARAKNLNASPSGDSVQEESSAEKSA